MDSREARETSFPLKSADMKRATSEGVDEIPPAPCVQPSQPKDLLPFVGYPRQEMSIGLPFRLQDYLELLDWTGRQFRQGKRGAIDEGLPPILERLNIDPDKWLYTPTHFESSFRGFVGTVQSGEHF